MRSLPLLCALLALGGCLAAEQDPTLERMQSCDQLKSIMSDVASTEARFTYRFDWDPDLDCVLGCQYEIQDLQSSPPQSLDSQGADQYSTTNLQEGGVDEMDLVKTDGELIYALSGESLYISRAWPLDQAELLSSVQLDGWPMGIYLVDDLVVALSEIWWTPSPRSGDAPSSGQDELWVGLTVVDVSDPAAPEVVRETYLAGQLRDSRRIGEQLYLVSYNDLRVWGRASDWDAAREAIREAQMEEVLPRQLDYRRQRGSWTGDSSQAVACSDVWTSRRHTGTLLTTVTTLDLSDPLSDLRGQSVMGRADTVYSSTDTLYVAWSEGAEGPFRSFDEQLDTVIHAFDLSRDVPDYLDTIQVWGVLPDQFALSEYDGVLRLATTDHTDWTTHVFSYARGEELERLDHLGGLAPGEELYAARFKGELAFLVTYVVVDGQSNQTGSNAGVFDVPFGDPLFTLDLSDPHAIRAVGELVLNGWSDYIHPLRDQHLLTVGMDEDDEEQWRVAISLFDVSDLAEPVLEDRELLDAVSSAAQGDHHAFNYFAPQEVLALPAGEGWADDTLQVVHVDLDDVSSVGQLRAPFAGPWGCTQVRRSVIFEDKVWALATGGLAAASLDDPATLLQTVDFRIDGCF